MLCGGLMIWMIQVIHAPTTSYVLLIIYTDTAVRLQHIELPHCLTWWMYNYTDGYKQVSLCVSNDVLALRLMRTCINPTHGLKVEYHANENPLQNSEK